MIALFVFYSMLSAVFALFSVAGERSTGHLLRSLGWRSDSRLLISWLLGFLLGLAIVVGLAVTLIPAIDGLSEANEAGGFRLSAVSIVAGLVLQGRIETFLKNRAHTWRE